MKKSHKNNRSGSTLIIVVLFMGLLVGLAILFLLSSLTASKLSNTSASGEKTTNLAMGASDIIIGDLRQEIKDGSTVPTGEPSTGYAGSSPSIVYPVYQPKPAGGTGAVSTAVPTIVGFTPTFTGTAPYYEKDGLANLLKISKYNVAFYNDPSNPNSNFGSTVGVSRASNTSTSYPSLDGKVITPARWNSHYLIQRQGQGYSLDSTPIGNQSSTSPEGVAINTFPEQPDWVIVTRTGAQKAYANTPTNLTTLSDPTNAQYAVGRFAYAIYNEGGLLDMNAAGYPSPLTASSMLVNNEGPASKKGALAFADLTQLSLTPGGTSLLTSAQVDQIVGWRNAYTAQLSGTAGQFGSIQFTSTAATSWINNFAAYNICQTNSTLPNFGLKNGFMSANGNPLSSTTQQSLSASNGSLLDQMFISRSQLISLIESLATMGNTNAVQPDVLQYMGTFSRSLEQPSYIPNLNPTQLRPTVGQGFASSVPPPSGGNQESNYKGNNDAQGKDYIVSAPSTSINPPFLTVRVQNSFVRYNGQTANVGEPLVLYRFPLSYLAMVAYNATNTSLPTGFAATNSDKDPIKDHFGLTRTLLTGPTGANPWIYNHGANRIYSLAEVAAQNREPDFAELLKASITAGGLAKGAPNEDSAASLYANYQYTYDATVDFQVLQIMANLIDQQDSDSYPTWIQLASDSSQLPTKAGITTPTNIYGVEDLPYVYGWHRLAVEDSAPYYPTTPNPPPATINAWTDSKFTRYVAPAYQFDATGAMTNNTTFNSGTPTVPLGPGTYPNLPAPQIPNIYNIQEAVSVPTGTTLSYVPGLGGSAGEVTFLYVPDLWNPCDPTTAAQNQTGRPTSFRIWAQSSPPPTVSANMTVPPAAGPGANQWWLQGITAFSGNVGGSNGLIPGGNYPNPVPTIPPFYQPVTAIAPFTQASTELDFSDNNGLLFREPTLLWNNSPAASTSGINLTAVNKSLPVKDPINGAKFYGIFVGQCPVLYEFSLSSIDNSTGLAPTSPALVTADSGQAPDGTYVAEATTINENNASIPGIPGGTMEKFTFYLQYLDGNNNWVTYDVKYSDEHNVAEPKIFTNLSDIGSLNSGGNNYTAGQYYNPLTSGSLVFDSFGVDPRTARWGMSLAPGAVGGVTKSSTGSGASTNGQYWASPVLDPTANGSTVADANILGSSLGGSNKLSNNAILGTSKFSVFETNRPRADKGNTLSYSCPGTLSSGSTLWNVQLRLFGGANFSGTAPETSSQLTAFFSGMLSQNNPSVNVVSKDNSTAGVLYFEDADGVCRRAMGAYADPNIVDADSDLFTGHAASGPTFNNLPEAVVAGTFPNAGAAFPGPNTRIGLPEATASNIQAGSTALGTATPTQQAQSRPIILNRPFRSVSEMSYAFTGTPWKNIDFFTPESAYSALLDTFCVGQAPANGLVAGKVDLNTRQAPVIQALVSGASRDEWNTIPTPAVKQLTPPTPLPPITSTEAATIAERLVAYTTDKTDVWRGPLTNVSDLVGRYIPTMPSISPAAASTYYLPGATAPDWYTYNQPSLSAVNATSSTTYSYAGFTGLLDSSVYTSTVNNSNLVSPIIQRFKESGLRPLADCGQTRVWNLLIDVIAQSGKYPKSATGLDQFSVDGEKRMWVHVAIDRETGEVLDKQIEVVNQ